MTESTTSDENNNEHPMIEMLVEASFECCIIRNAPCPFATGIRPAELGPRVMMLGCSRRPDRQITRKEAVSCQTWLEIIKPSKPVLSDLAAFLQGRTNS